MAMFGTRSRSFAHNLLELLHGVESAHRLEDVVVARLQRQMHMLHHFGQFGDCANQVVAEVARVGRGEADALDAVDVAQEFEQSREGHAPLQQVLAVGVDGLPQQGDFFGAALGESAHFLDDVGGRSAALAPARGRHDAEGAELVAAVLDGHERLEFRARGQPCVRGCR
jgi:hypothetical protein